MKWLNFLRSSRPKRKTFSAWQIELTTRCPLSCRMCIRDEAEDWFSSDMDIEDFKKLTPFFREVETVVLEGWGESLLHKNIIEVIGLVKAEGAQAGFVTSGRVLNRDYISELINAGVDFIGFSLSGANPATHNSIRVNSDLQSLMGYIQTFNEIKIDKKIKNPKLHIVYLMLKDNISEVPSLLELAKEIGIEEVVLTNLIHITNEWQESQRVFRCLTMSLRGAIATKQSQEHLVNNEIATPPSVARNDKREFIEQSAYGIKVDKQLRDYEKILKEAEIKAKEFKIRLRRPSLSPIDVTVCEENPLRNLYISVDGEVSPCVYLHPPLPSPFKRIFCGAEYQTKKVSFGNIFREPFDAIWNNREYVEFRERFMLRKRRFEEIYSPFLDIERLKRFEVTPLPDPPEQCRTCHKMLGV